MTTEKHLQKKHDELVKENGQLRKKLKFYNSIATSWGLPKHISAYFDKASPKQPFPDPQTARLGAAVINRTVVGTTFHVIIAIATVCVLVLQTHTLRTQNLVLDKQANYLSDSLSLSKLHDLQLQNREGMQFLYDTTCKLRSDDRAESQSIYASNTDIDKIFSYIERFKDIDKSPYLEHGAMKGALCVNLQLNRPSLS